MERQGTIKQMAGAMAPAAPQSGRGTGNIPYAKGMVSGNFGPKPTPAPSSAGAEPAPGGAPSAPARPSPTSGGPPPSMAAPPTAAAAQNPFLDRMFYFDEIGRAHV